MWVEEKVEVMLEKASRGFSSELEGAPPWASQIIKGEPDGRRFMSSQMLFSEEEHVATPGK